MRIQEFRPGRFQILPPVVKNLLIINGLLFFLTYVLQLKFGLDLTRYLGLHFVTSEYFRPHQFITHLFMHGSMLHIISSMFALWMFGNVLENVWGPKRFLIFYFVTGVGAALIHTLATWYEIDQMRQVVEGFVASVHPVDFKLLVNKYQHYIGRAEMEQVARFYTEWQQVPSDTAYAREAVDFAYLLLKNKADIPTVGAS